MATCPLCDEPAKVDASRAGVLNFHCEGCGQFALSPVARLSLTGSRVNRGDRLWLARRVRAEYDATRVAVMLFTTKLRDWLTERAASRQPAEAAPTADPDGERGRLLRQRQAQVVAQSARQIDLATALRWRAREAAEEAQAARRETHRVRTEGLGPVLAARVGAGCLDAIFGVGLQRARRVAGMSQAALGQQIGRPATWVSAVERGDRRLDRAAMQTLAEAVGSDLDALLSWPERDADQADEGLPEVLRRVAQG